MAITTQYCTGFESGLVSAAGNTSVTVHGGLGDVIAGTATATSTNPHSGTYCLVVGTGVSSTNGWVKYLPITTRAKTIRYWLRIDTAPATTIAVMLPVTAGTVGDPSLNVTSALLLRGTEGANQTSIGTLTLNTWHMIEIQYDFSANPRTMKVKLDGAAAVTVSSATAAKDLDGIRFGSVGSNTGVARFDDLVLGDFTNATDDWYGDGSGVALLAGSDGTHSFTANDFSTGDAGTQRAQSYTDFYLMVDDPLPWTTTRSTTDNIAQRVVRAAGYVEIDPVAADTSKSNANGVQALLAYSSSTATTNNAGCIIRNSTPADVTIWGASGATADYSESTNFFKGVQVTKPAGNWTSSEISALRWRFGYSGDISPVPTAQMLMLEVDYPPTVAAVIPDLNMAPMRAP